MKKVMTLLMVFAVSSVFLITDLYGKTGSREEFIREPIFNSKIYFFESGKGHAKSVVLIHGIGDEGAGIWKNLIPELENKYHVVAFDLPGFARSSKENDLYSPQNYAAFVNWIVKKYTKGPLYIIGHSLGGAIALYYAGTYPENLERIIIVDSAGILNRSAFIKKFINVEPNKFMDMMNIPASTIQNLMIANLESMDRGFRDETGSSSLSNELLKKKLYSGDPAKTAGMVLLNTDFSNIIDKIKVPSLIIWGEKDPVSPLRIGRLLEWMLPDSDLRIMPGLGHCPMVDRPVDFNKIIMDWITVSVKKKEIKTPSFTGNKIFKCEGKDCVISNGDYDRIEVKNSNETRIVGITAKHIYIEGSIVSIESSYIKSGDVGVKAIDSVVNMSGCSIDSDIAVLTSNSSVDLAGVKITGRTAAIKEAALKSEDMSTIIFSVSKIKSPFNDGYKHEIKLVTERNPY
ncbi:MAG TPA: alpha/beta hydrolase [Syntrophales bacterium]|nr:alpha/beta hydrolase [Syntrophales bacterium]